MGGAWAGRMVTNARKAIRAQGQIQQCRRCGRPIDLDSERWQVGHIHDQALGGGHEPSNLLPEHGSCNESAGSLLGHSMRRARQRESVEREQKLRKW